MDFWQHGDRAKILRRGRSGPHWLFSGKDGFMVARYTRVFGFVLIMMGVGSLFPVSGVAEPSLDTMKVTFTELIRERAGLAGRMASSQKTIVTARSATRAGGAAAPTATGYRDAVMRVERALDVHPQIVNAQERYDAMQSEKVAVSEEQAAILDAWHAAKKTAADELETQMQARSARLLQERAAVLESAGVKNAEALTETDRTQMREIRARFTKEISTVKRTHAEHTSISAVKAMHVQDGSAARFEALGTQYKEIEANQAGVKAEMDALRHSLRRRDAEIGKLQHAAYAASQKHVLLMDAKPEVVEARTFIRNVPQIRAGIDRKLRVLRSALLAAEPEYKPELDKQAVVGGLALVGDDFWEL